MFGSNSSFMSALSLPLIINRRLHGHNWRYVISISPALTITIFLSYFLSIQFSVYPQRFLFVISLFGTIFTAYLLSYLLTSVEKILKSLKSYIYSTVVIFFIFCLFVGGLFALYPSPYTLSVNLQNTQSEAVGVIYVLEHRDVDVSIYEISGVIGRFSYAFLNPEERVRQKLPLFFEQQRISSHFGYDTNRSISAMYDRETDIILTQLDKKIRRYISRNGGIPFTVFDLIGSRLIKGSLNLFKWRI